MWAEETGCNKERVFFVFLHQSDCFRRNHSVGLFFVFTICRQPAKGSTNLSVWFRIENKMFIGFVTTYGIHGFLPGRGIIKPIGSNRCRNIVVINFSDSPGPPSMLHELLRKRDCIRYFIPKMSIQVIDLDRIWTESGHHGCPGRVAQGELIIRV